MSIQFVESVAFDAIKLILTVSGPLLFTALLVGLTVSVFQATTQINEMTLAYIPKILAIYGMLILTAGFILDRLTQFTTGIFSDFSRFVL
ncbi:MAG: flagellar biosynthetic protein FliQ [Bradymonadales bacterium]|nr:MAG: flagellar biosynthetic protein FliQ [Bradymonadales bacterium]